MIVIIVLEVPKTTSQKGDADTPLTVPTNGHHHYTASKENSSQYIEESHTASAKVETLLKDLNNDTAAAPSAVPTNTDFQGPSFKNGLKQAIREARIKELEAELDSQRRQGPDEEFFFLHPALQATKRPAPSIA